MKRLLALITAAAGAACALSLPAWTLVLAAVCLTLATLAAVEVAAIADARVARSAWDAVTRGVVSAEDGGDGGGTAAAATSSHRSWARRGDPHARLGQAQPRWVHPADWESSSDDERSHPPPPAPPVSAHRAVRPPSAVELSTDPALIAANWSGRPPVRGLRRPASRRGVDAPPPSPAADGHGHPRPPPGWVTALPCDACAADVAAALALWERGQRGRGQHE